MLKKHLNRLLSPGRGDRAILQHKLERHTKRERGLDSVNDKAGISLLDFKSKETRTHLSIACGILLFC